MYSLGIDLGSSSVKVSLMDINGGKCLCSSTNPVCEMPISSPGKGWAEQNPDMWWDYVCAGVLEIGKRFRLSGVVSIGISYQMHGLVAVDRNGKPVRDAIIWCDSRAVGLGERAFSGIGESFCLEHLLNSPGNFTMSKLAWVKENEPEVYSRIWKIMLPGDYIAYRLSGEIFTGRSGLSEQIAWDFKENRRADFLMDYFGIEYSLLPDVVPSISVSSKTTRAVEDLLGIPTGTPVSYRAGDQPNNAFSLNVLNPGEIAATAGTSGVVYGVTDRPDADSLSRVNTFLHVNDGPEARRLGILLCINGTGILNSWIHHNMASDLSYSQIDEQAATVPPGSDGLLVHPFGNGAERVLSNRNVLASVSGWDFVRHERKHFFRAAQEGIAFSFRYGIDIMRGLGSNPEVIRAGKANMFLSSIFRSSLASLCGSRIEIFDTDGALGAARGAALGAGFYKSSAEAFEALNKVSVTTADPSLKDQLEPSYQKWKEQLEKQLNN